MHNKSFETLYFELVTMVSQALEDKPYDVAVYSIINVNGDLFLTITMSLKEYHRLKLQWEDCPMVGYDDHQYISLHLKGKLIVGFDQVAYTFPNTTNWLDIFTEEALDVTFNDVIYAFLKHIDIKMRKPTASINELDIDHPFLNDGICISPI